MKVEQIVKKREGGGNHLKKIEKNRKSERTEVNFFEELMLLFTLVDGN